MRFPKKLLVAGLLLAMIVSGFAFVGGAAASANFCFVLELGLSNDTDSTSTAYGAIVNLQGNVFVSSSLMLAPGESGTLLLVGNLPLNQSYLHLDLNLGNLTLISLFTDLPTRDNCDGGSIGDGRLNDGANQLAAPVAVYCEGGNINVYSIDPETGAGELAVSVEQVSGTPADGTMLLGANMGVEIYWREDGKYQVNTLNFEGNLYSIAWHGCSGADFEHIAPQPVF